MPVRTLGKEGAFIGIAYEKSEKDIVRFSNFLCNSGSLKYLGLPKKLAEF